MGGFFSSLFGGGSGGGGGGQSAPQVITPEMKPTPLMQNYLIPGAESVMAGSMPILQDPRRTMMHFEDPQYNHDPMVTPKFDPNMFAQMLGQQRQTAQGWQNNLNSFFPSPWGTMLSYAGTNGTYRRPTDGGMPQGGGPTGGQGGGAGGGGGAFQGGGDNLERYVARDPNSNQVVGGSFETPEQWARYNGFSNPGPQQAQIPPNLFQIPTQAPMSVETPQQWNGPAHPVPVAQETPQPWMQS